MWNITEYDELPSTQTLAKEMLLSGEAENFTVIVAKHQTEGRGRMKDRTWHDEPGTNLLMSIIYTDIPSHLNDNMQFVMALSVLTLIRPWLAMEYNVQYESVRLKWINDIYVDKKKIAGVLTEAVWSGETLKGIVAGIGININQLLFPPEIADHAISLRHFTHQELPIELIRNLMLDTIHICTTNYGSAESVILDLRKELEWMRNTPAFSLTEPDGTNFSGLRYDGITAEGALQCITPQGSKKIFQNATVHIP